MKTQIKLVDVLKKYNHRSLSIATTHSKKKLTSIYPAILLLDLWNITVKTDQLYKEVLKIDAEEVAREKRQRAWVIEVTERFFAVDTEDTGKNKKA